MASGQLTGEWYSETSELWPGQAMSLKVKEKLHECRSDFQDVLVRTPGPPLASCALLTYRLVPPGV